MEQKHSSVKDVFVAFRKKVHSLSGKQLTTVLILIAAVIVGNAMQLICINFWLAHFDNVDTGSFTTLAVSGFLYAFFFLLILIVWCIRHRPYWRWVLTWKGFHVLFWIGFFDATNSFLSVYATNGGTPEVLQALFGALSCVFCFLLSKLLLGDPRNYCNLWAVSSMVLMIGGVAISAIPTFTTSGQESNSKRWWSFIYFCSVPLGSLYNVLQAKYMEDYTNTSLEGVVLHQCDIDACTTRKDEYGAAITENRGGGNSLQKKKSSELNDKSNGGITPAKRSEVINNDDDEVKPKDETINRVLDPSKGDDATVKFFMLFGDTLGQFIVTMTLLPVDSIPWYGSSDSTRASWGHFTSGLSCVFTCHLNLLFTLLYVLGFVLTYLGSAYLNHYSATLCSMITQLASPITALVLIVIPSWNLQPSPAAWYWDLVAVVVLTAGAIIYSVWEEMEVLDVETVRIDVSDRRSAPDNISINSGERRPLL